MSEPKQAWEELELLRHDSASPHHIQLDDCPYAEEDDRSFDPSYSFHDHPLHPILHYFRSWLPFRNRRYHSLSVSPFPRRGTSWVRRISLCVAMVPTVVIILIIFTGIFLPSYTHPPAHYATLRQHAKKTQLPGRANINNEKVFIAASIYDYEGQLASGGWGRDVLDLVDILGPDNVYLSLYENDPGSVAKNALESLGERARCESCQSTSIHYSS